MNLFAKAIAVGAAAIAATSASAQANNCNITFGAAFSGYACADLGTPTGVPAQLGGLTFLNNDTLLIGGSANNGAGVIRSIGVTRGADNRITGFSGSSAFFANAPNIDGGLTFAPNGTLLTTTYSDNRLLQYLPGSTDPDRTIDLSALGITSSTGTLAFVPGGFGGATRLKIASYTGNNLYDVTYTVDANGLLTLGTATQVAQFASNSGPEGLAYVTGANPGFTGSSLLVSEYRRDEIGAYTVDASGDPLVASRQTFLSGLSGAQGAVIDPLTGDFLFSTFGGGNRVLRITGFEAPPSGVPEPATWVVMVGGFGLVGGGLRVRRRATVSLA